MSLDTMLPKNAEMGSRPIVEMYLINGIMVVKRSVVAGWKVGRLGIRQVQRMVSYLVAHADRAIHWEVLATIGSRTFDPYALAKPRNLTAGIRHLFRQWEIEEALYEANGYFTLRRNTCWISDTDRIEKHDRAATEAASAGDAEQTLAHLQQAGSLCNGPYLPNYDVPEYSLAHLQQHWQVYQRDVLHRLARIALQRSAYNVALSAAQQTFKLGISEASDCDLMAECYTALGHMNSADYYRRKAASKRRNSR
ncbi:MAG: hypothetical protein HC822_24085 [Oscillochloris sp.]|nr:hypothetical protein [Oscillochloris sp.]